MNYDLAVVGLGYVGLPLAVEATKAGLSVLGIDIADAVIQGLRRGVSHVDDISDAELQDALATSLVVASDPSELSSAQNISICVPTPWNDRSPDLTAVIAATEAIGDRLMPGQLVVLESTTYPGTTEEVVQPILEERSGLSANTDFFLAFSPERIDPGNTEWTLLNTPKLVGGVDQRSTDQAEIFYRKFCQVVVPLSGTREAEMAKLLENTYRQVNIALMNEMAVFCRELGVDLWEAIRGAATKPFGFQAFYPSAGIGGHCIPIDPSYLHYRVTQLGHSFRFVELAQEINARMSTYVVERIIGLLNAAGKALLGSKILLVGVSYKANISDTRETPALHVGRLLKDMGAELTYLDPHVEGFEIEGDAVTRADDPVTAARAADLVVFLTAHSSLDLDEIAQTAPLAFDATGRVARDHVETL